MKRPLAVALTGGIAAGKSEALQAFARHGAATISTDDVVHRLYREDDGLQAALRQRWGERVFRDGEVDRAEIGRIVFADRAELALARVRAASARPGGDRRLARASRPPTSRSPRSRCCSRPAARCGSTGSSSSPRRPRCGPRDASDLAEREARLVPEDEKVRRADFSYVNDGSLEELDAFVAGVLEELRRS